MLNPPDRARPGEDRPEKPVDPVPEKPKFAAPGDVLRAYRSKFDAADQPETPEPERPTAPAPGFVVVTGATRRGHVRAITVDGDWTGSVDEAAVFETADAAEQLARGIGSGARVAPRARLEAETLDDRPAIYLQSRA